MKLLLLLLAQEAEFHEEVVLQLRSGYHPGAAALTPDLDVDGPTTGET